jgi:hypothetical protein
MLGEQVSRQAGKALVADVCARAKSNGCNLLEQPRDKLAAYIKVGRHSWCTGNGQAQCRNKAR